MVIVFPSTVVAISPLVRLALQTVPLTTWYVSTSLKVTQQYIIYNNNKITIFKKKLVNVKQVLHQVILSINWMDVKWLETSSNEINLKLAIGRMDEHILR
jgi:hypothetical protein